MAEEGGAVPCRPRLRSAMQHNEPTLGDREHGFCGDLDAARHVAVDVEFAGAGPWRAIRNDADRTCSEPKESGEGEQDARFHFAVEDARLLHVADACFEVAWPIPVDRHAQHAVVRSGDGISGVKSVEGPGDSSLRADVVSFRSLDQGPYDFPMGDRWELGYDVGLACSIVAHAPGRDRQIAEFEIRVEPARVSDSDHRRRAEFDQFFDEHGRARCADSVRGCGERHAVLFARDDGVFAYAADLAPRIPILADAIDARGIAA